MGTQVPAPSAGLNEAIIHGQFVAEPEFRELPSGLVAASFSLTVRRPGEKTTSVPMCWFGPPKRLSSWAIGEMVVARGRVVRRFYRAGAALGSATEVVVTHAELARHAGKAHKVVSASTATIAAVVEELAGSANR